MNVEEFFARESHLINEILLNVLKKDEMIENLIKCVERIVMLPRFELISTVDVLSDYMIEKHKLDNDFRKNIDTVKNQAISWILSSDNKNFSEMWEFKKVPEYIEDMFIREFGSDINTLVNKYIESDEPQIDLFLKKIYSKQISYLRKWHLPKQHETEILSENLETTHLREIEAAKTYQRHVEFEKIHVGGKTFKERQKETEEASKLISETKDNKMENTKRLINLKYTNIQEIKKLDKDRFQKIFLSYENKFGKISDSDKNKIMNIWYGNYFTKEDSSSDDILSTVRKHSLHFKIQNDHISGTVNRLILQTYITGLYLGITVLDIYTIINDVIKSNPSITSHIIMPMMIHNGNIPNLKIQEILNPIIENIPLHGEQNRIRENWNKLRFPSIDISALVKHLRTISLDSSLKFEIIRSIEDLSENVVKNNLTLERFASGVYDILKNQTMKIPITEKGIRSLLNYENR